MRCPQYVRHRKRPSGRRHLTDFDELMDIDIGVRDQQAAPHGLLSEIYVERSHKSLSHVTGGLPAAIVVPYSAAQQRVLVPAQSYVRFAQFHFAGIVGGSQIPESQTRV